MKYCPQCSSNDVPDTMNTCPYCGYCFDEKNGKNKTEKKFTTLVKNTSVQSGSESQDSSGKSKGNKKDILFFSFLAIATTVYEPCSNEGETNCPPWAIPEAAKLPFTYTSAIPYPDIPPELELSNNPFKSK